MFVYGSVAGYRYAPNFYEKVRSNYSISQGRVSPGFSGGGRSTRYGQQIVSDKSVIFNFYSDYQTNFDKLRTAARDLTKNNNTSAFEKRAVEVRDPHLFKAEADYGALIKVYDVAVKELGVARQEKTGFFNKDKLVVDNFKDDLGNNLLNSTEEYVFRLTQGGISEEFTVKLDDAVVSGSDDKATFAGVFQQIADKINESSLNVTASFGRDFGLSSEVRLSITANDKGTAADFKIEDVKRVEKDPLSGKDIIVPQHGLIETLSLKTENAAKDASVSIDGVQGYNYFARGDQVFLFQGHDVEMNLTSTGQTYFMVTKDVREIKDSIETFTNEYNNTLSFLRGTGRNGETDRLIERVVQIAKDESDKLKAIGISVDEQGRMVVEKGLFDGVLEKKLEKDFGMVEDILGGLNGIATKISSLADDSLQLSPLRFMNEAPEFKILDVLRDAYDTMGRMMFEGYGHQGMIIDMTL